MLLAVFISFSELVLGRGQLLPIYHSASIGLAIEIGLQIQRKICKSLSFLGINSVAKSITMLINFKFVGTTLQLATKYLRISIILSLFQS
jgi:hypothetical protein